jgi:tripartite-type tricarboxylate transporter receptor subunit TctC
MNNSRMKSIFSHLLIAVSLLLSGLSHAQEYAGPISLVVGFPPGGTADLGARILAEKLPSLLGQPVIVENRSGAGGQIAARYVKAANADGSVLFFTNGHTVVTVPQVTKAPGFDTAADLRPVSQFANFELVLAVHPSSQAKSLKDLMEHFTRTPSARVIAVPAPGSTPEFIVGRMAQLLQADVQPIPYRGAAPAVQDLLGGQVVAAVLPVGDVLQYQKAGRLTALAVTNPTPLLPGVPAFGELGLPELAAGDFLAVYAPARMSDANVRRYSNAIRQVLAMPDVIEKIRLHAMQPQSGSPEQMDARYRESSARVLQLISAVGYKPQ